jgi:D-3-phosphoglycerate dehydrogenase
VLVDGIGVEAPLGGTMIVIRNNDQPGVIGEVGTILARHGVNIATFALGREGRNAIGVVIVDEVKPIPDAVLEDLRKVSAIREARIVRV